MREIHYQIKGTSLTYLLMSRSPAPICLPRKPDLLQNIPNIKISCKPTESRTKKQELPIEESITTNIKEQSKGLLLPLHLVIYENRCSKCTTADLLHDLVMIHPRLHFSYPQLQKPKTRTQNRSSDVLSTTFLRFSSQRDQIPSLDLLQNSISR